MSLDAVVVANVHLREILDILVALSSRMVWVAHLELPCLEIRPVDRADGIKELSNIFKNGVLPSEDACPFKCQ